MNIADKYGTPEYRRAVVELYTRYLAWVDAGKPEHDEFEIGGGLCDLMPFDYGFDHIDHIIKLYNKAFPFSCDIHGTHETAQLARENHVRTYLSHHAQEFAA